MENKVKELPKTFELTEAEVAARQLLDGKAAGVEDTPEEMDCEEFWRRVDELLRPFADKGMILPNR
ncbi:MAG: hypothetical protein AMJ53_16735 [Gammaproteobacteria bacterium SG8_11]|nr:MAG: hypothetical protein AMJ53_16735 [Gammaproteobacteria bacterium SG8_11]